MLLKKDHVNSSNTLFHKAWDRFPYHQRPFQGASNESLHPLRSSQGISCDAGSTPITMWQKCLFLIFHTSIIRGRIGSYFQCGEMMRTAPP